MPELLLESTSPYKTRRAMVLRGDGDIYLYLEDLVGPVPTTTSAVWISNFLPAPSAGDHEVPHGAPPRMGAGGTQFPGGCPDISPKAKIMWCEEGDAVALVDSEGVVAAIPGWAGRDDFYGYSRYARGRSALAWELGREARSALEAKIERSRAFWQWRLNAWDELRETGLAHLEQRLGPKEVAWPIGHGSFPEMVASTHRLAEQSIWVTATTGLSAQRMAGVEQYVEDPHLAGRIELAMARRVPGQEAAELLSSIAAIPFGRCTWLGEGHTIGGTVGAYPGFGADKAAVLLTSTPPDAADVARPDLSGLAQGSEPVTYLWVMVIDEHTFGVARGRDAHAALAHLETSGASWIQ